MIGALLLGATILLGVVLAVATGREYLQTGEFNYFALMATFGTVVTSVQSAISNGYLPDTVIYNSIVVIAGVLTLVFGAIFARNFDWSSPERHL
jgi:hypothetical protein